MNNPSLVLIAFKYPPYSGVGAFRWSNLSKELAELGWIVHVVTVQWNCRSDSSFLDILNHKNIIIHILPSLGPHRMTEWRAYGGALGLAVRIFRRIVERLLSPFYYIDVAQQWGRIMIPFVKNLLVTTGCNVLVATGAPFSVNHAAARIKTELGDRVRLIQDFRDPWNDLPSYVTSFGSARRRANSEKMEHESLACADAVITVTKGVARLFQERTEQVVQVIYNGYPSNLVSKLRNSPKLRPLIRVVYAGTFSHGRDKTFIKFLLMLQNQRLSGKIIFDIYGAPSKFLRQAVRSLQNPDSVSFQDRVNYENLMNIIPDYDYGLHLNGRLSIDALSTKIFDYLAVGIPVLSVNYGDEIHGFLTENGFGYSVRLDNGQQEVDLAELIEKKPVRPDPGRVAAFSYRNIALQYIKILEGGGM